MKRDDKDRPVEAVSVVLQMERNYLLTDGYRLFGLKSAGC